jgi:hypothetical protein
MPVLRSVSAAIVILALIAAGAAAGQTAAPSSPPSSTTSFKIDDVSKWTSKQWSAAKAKWAKEKQKWVDCRKQSKELKLSGKQSWSFLAMCMTG